MSDEQQSSGVERFECDWCGHDDQGEAELIQNDGHCEVCGEVLEQQRVRSVDTETNQRGQADE